MPKRIKGKLEKTNIYANPHKSDYFNQLSLIWCKYGEKHLHLQVSGYQDVPQHLNCKSSSLANVRLYIHAKLFPVLLSISVWPLILIVFLFYLKLKPFFSPFHFQCLRKVIFAHFLSVASGCVPYVYITY